MNRSYYAAFGEAADYARRIGYTYSGGAGSHKQVWRFIGAHSDGDATRDATRRAIESQGLFLKDRRHKADYRRMSRLAKGEPAAALKESTRIISALDVL